MKLRICFFMSICALALCRADLIKDRPISFSPWRVQETIKYVNERYDRSVDSLEMLPVMVVSHFTAMDDLEVSFKYMNNEHMESGRGVLRNAGQANIAVHFLVAKSGDVYRLMPENHIGRHVIGLNRHAIGIENVGKDEKALTQAQVQANAYIVRHLVKKFPIRYLIGHSEYRNFETTPLWEERDAKYRTEKVDPGESFMQPLRLLVADLNLKAAYDGGEIPVRIDHVLTEYHAKKFFNGAALVMRNGQVIFRKVYGKADGQSARALSAEDRFYIASAAKSFTATAVALLTEKKKISYEDTVVRFFPGLSHLLAGVKIKHLLSHTSGIEDYYKLVKAVPGFTNQDALAALALQKRQLTKPGSRFYYSNSNYILLAEIVAKISGQSFTDFVQENILRKAAMAATHFSVNAAGSGINPPPALDAEGKEFSYSFKTAGAGGLYTTPYDLALFDTALWNHELLSARMLQRLIEPQAHVDTKDTDYAFGWYVYPKRGVMYHDGNFSGYHSMNWLQPKEKNAIILLSNNHTAKIKEITYEIDRILNGMAASRLK